MALNIKDKKAYDLAHRLAAETGETMTQAVIEALRERLVRVRRRRQSHATAQALLAIGRRCARHLRTRTRDHDVLLYDKHGLPR